MYTPLPPSLLPPLYLAFNVAVGGDSGKVHSTVKERWAAREPGLVAGMQALAALADEARSALERGDAAGLAALMRRNFALRRRLYGDGVVGAGNIAMIEHAEAALGLSCKFTGSGGALLCARSDGRGWLSAEDEARAVAEFAARDFELVRVCPALDTYRYD